MSLKTNECVVYGEGKVMMSRNLGVVKLENFGSMEHDLNTDSIRFETIMALDFFFEKDLIKQISELFEKSVNAEPVPFTRPIYERSLTEHIGKKEADKIISQVNLYGNFRKVPDELEHTFFFSDVKFKWNKPTKSFVSVGKIGIGNIFKNQLNKYYDGKIEIVQKRSGDSFTIYLADENNNWYYFTYSGNQMQAVSSDEKWNNAIREMKPEKRQVEKEKGKTAYVFSLTLASKAKQFLKKFEE
jgi:L-rhamnose mutarotase